MELDAGSKIKVTKFDGSEPVSVDTENVLGLQVAVGYSFGMKELQGRSDITNYMRCFLLGKEFPSKKFIYSTSIQQPRASFTLLYLVCIWSSSWPPDTFSNIR